jgi:hypothetical protein
MQVRRLSRFLVVAALAAALAVPLSTVLAGDGAIVPPQPCQLDSSVGLCDALGAGLYVANLIF